VQGIEVTVTNTETEALLLESNLIKRHQPRYNVLLRDDKSYPYIHVSTDHAFPRIKSYRGSKNRKGAFFGPFPSGVAVKETLYHLQKLFRLRKCTDSEFSNRSRPCLQYQIKRCSAPCVGKISENEYAQDIQHAIHFLQGKNDTILETLQNKMQLSSDQLDYEGAAFYRDQIAHLKRIQAQQLMSGFTRDLDCIATHSLRGVTGITIMFIRQGRNLGSRSYFPKYAKDTEFSEILDAFLTQYYLHHYPPHEILLDQSIQEKALLENVLSVQAKHKVQIKSALRGKRKQLMHMTAMNAEHAVTQYFNKQQQLDSRFDDIKSVLELEEVPRLICCFDISHTMGEATTASCVVFDHKGAKKSAYRRFNIRAVTDGDDYLALQEAVTRYLKRIYQDQKDENKSRSQFPDLMLIDGGVGQVNSVLKAIEHLHELELPPFLVAGVSKGAERKAGAEKIVMPHLQKELVLGEGSLALQLIQQVRDEAHRFALAGHRKRRGKSRTRSLLEEIEGLGVKRRSVLLKHFGGLQEVIAASVEDLTKVEGISHVIAERIYSHLHER
jgi:excinuclease ABC subunit C